MIRINVFSENINENISINERKFLTIAKKIFRYYMAQDFFQKSALWGYDYKCVTFDILYCDNEKTHEINREYRNKDYIADIITFAIFADSEEKFIFDNEINLGEFMISLDKIKENSEKNGTKFEYELSFLISHGIMHLLGFDHQTEADYNFVVKAQNEALSYLGIEK
ncbi:rRNA maturation RNase YbeY [bacterium]|nr:rRNA maturation RNase YbeY [bacterium]